MTTQTTQITPNAQAITMTDKMNLSSFIRLFDTPTDAIDYILEAHDAGNVETTEATIPYYTYNVLANPPRFIAYGDYAQQTHSYEVAITGLSLTMVIEFPMSDTVAIEWFDKHLSRRLSDSWGEFEREEINITDPDDLECQALTLQREVNLNRINKTRTYMLENDAGLNSEQFASNCRIIVELTDTNKAITERIQYINQLA